ncbi:nicotinate-nucleotide adenylyltransferase [Shewanella sp. MMG014]|uniref:nicotinate-nucleotide adenylyltransferase n=1 Tax=Shewanella sp. MMG014 TaxID=2822691 RepID=UPI001B38EC01|nr:nicotinate-nucleotide adenylyltransferase [Shewanella sp. MMG014]MBQ4891486.1 nicotinate-nucleotide adenylyltransferase [Shewanella sp. MMG014]
MKIGLLGGTFDPIHLGHIKPALEVLHQLNLDKIWLMPNHIPPHKQSTTVNSQHRLAMTQAVCELYDEFALCDIEINRDTPSYSVATLALLKQQYPQHQFYFIMGTDSFIQLPTWYRWQSLFDLCHIVVCQRPGWQLTAEHPMASVLADNQLVSTTALTGKIYPIEVQPQDISSTQIRQLLSNLTVEERQDSNNAQLNALLPEVIQQYICQHSLYQAN